MGFSACAMKQPKLLTLFAAAATTMIFAAGAYAQDDAKADTLVAGEFTFSYGKPWEAMEVKSSMRAGQLKYGEDGPELVFYYFGPGQGGGVQANIDRWVGQFDGKPESKQDEVEKGGKKIHFLEATGTYLESSGGPFSGNKTPREGYMLLGAILESAKGAVFLKLYGEQKAVEALKEDFKKVALSPVAE